MTEDYFEFCEKLWRGWKRQELTLGNVKVFDLNAAPEPYISFGIRAGAKPLVALTNNPGRTMRHQRRPAVQAGDGPLCKKDKYAQAARKLGRFYEEHLNGPAWRRMAKLRMLSCLLGYEGVLQVEACPFHSPSLPQKSALVREITKKDEFFGCYAEHLRAFLRGRPVVSPQAVSTQASLGKKRREFSPWLRQIAKIAGLDLNRAKFVPLIKKGSKTTAAAWVSDRPRKALVLMMGGNNLPAEEGLRKLAAELRKFWGLR